MRFLRSLFLLSAATIVQAFPILPSTVVSARVETSFSGGGFEFEGPNWRISGFNSDAGSGSALLGDMYTFFNWGVGFGSSIFFTDGILTAPEHESNVRITSDPFLVTGLVAENVPVTIEIELRGCTFGGFDCGDPLLGPYQYSLQVLFRAAGRITWQEMLEYDDGTGNLVTELTGPLLSLQAVPEPGSLALTASAIAAAMWLRRRGRA